VRTRRSPSRTRSGTRSGTTASTSRSTRAARARGWATKNEWLGLVDVAGLELESFYGSFDREPVSDESREYVVVATRRE
jgi:hypothetical protein